jgi:hypothetical protein
MLTAGRYGSRHSLQSQEAEDRRPAFHARSLKPQYARVEVFT